MKNSIIFVSKLGLLLIREKSKFCNSIFLAEIDGAYIRTEEEFVREMDNAFNVPYEESPLKFGYWNDHMHDLMWIEQRDIVLLIRNYEQLLNKDIQLKERIIEQLNDIILPWWEYDVVDHMVGGEVRRFDVYISR